MFCFICSEQCIKIISLRKMCGLISSVFQKIIPYNTITTFKEVSGVIQSLIFGAIRSKFDFQDSISEVSSIFVF